MDNTTDTPAVATARSGYTGRARHIVHTAVDSTTGKVNSRCIPLCNDRGNKGYSDIANVHAFRDWANRVALTEEDWADIREHCTCGSCLRILKGMRG